jgi:hypothetical protein
VILPFVEKAIRLLDERIELLQWQMQCEKMALRCPFERKNQPLGGLKWTGKTVDYVEWIYALYGVLNLNGGTVTFKKLFEVFNGVFGLDVKDFSLYFMSIKNRKKGDRTSFLDLGKRLLIERMEEMDKKPARR